MVAAEGALLQLCPRATCGKCAEISKSGFMLEKVEKPQIVVRDGTPPTPTPTQGQSKAKAKTNPHPRARATAPEGGRGNRRDSIHAAQAEAGAAPAPQGKAGGVPAGQSACPAESRQHPPDQREGARTSERPRRGREAIRWQPASERAARARRNDGQSRPVLPALIESGLCRVHNPYQRD